MPGLWYRTHFVSHAAFLRFYQKAFIYLQIVMPTVISEHMLPEGDIIAYWIHGLVKPLMTFLFQQLIKARHQERWLQLRSNSISPCYYAKFMAFSVILSYHLVIIGKPRAVTVASIQLGASGVTWLTSHWELSHILSTHH